MLWRRIHHGGPPARNSALPDEMLGAARRGSARRSAALQAARAAVATRYTMIPYRLLSILSVLPAR
jgi:hypothetical protein